MLYFACAVDALTSSYQRLVTAAAYENENLYIAGSFMSLFGISSDFKLGFISKLSRDGTVENSCD